MMQCEYCGKNVVEDPDWYRGECDGKLTYNTDPYEEEINDDHSMYWDCEGRRFESQMDI